AARIGVLEIVASLVEQLIVRSEELRFHALFEQRQMFIRPLGEHEAAAGGDLDTARSLSVAGQLAQETQSDVEAVWGAGVVEAVQLLRLNAQVRMRQAFGGPPRSPYPPRQTRGGQAADRVRPRLLPCADEADRAAVLGALGVAEHQPLVGMGIET